MRDNYWARRASRRRFLQGSGVAAVGTGAILAGCGGDNGGSTATTTRAATGASTTAASSPAGTATTAAAGAKPKDGSFYSAYISLTGSTLDLHRELYTGIAQTAGLAYDSLLAWGDAEKGVIKPEIAATLPEQPDPLTYRFTIRQDVKWQNKAPANGRALTMDDIKWNIERQTNRTLASGEAAKNFYRYNSLYQFIDKAEFTDSTHFTITLKQPRPIWLSTFAEQFNVIQYREVAEEIEKNPAQFDAKNVLGTGPYIFDDYSGKKRAHAVRNPDYFLKKASQEVQFFDEVLWTDLGTDLNARRIAFEQKQIDIITATKDVIEAIESSQKGNVQRLNIAVPNANLEVKYNPVANQAFANPNIRQAIFLAIDRPLAGQQYFQGLARPNPMVPWPYVDWALPQTELANVPGYRQNKDEDLKEARRLWDAAAASSLPKELFELVVTDQQDQAIKEWWPAMMNKNLNTDRFSLRTIPVGTLLDYLLQPASNGYLGAWTLWDSPDPRSQLFNYYSKTGTNNFFKYDNAELQGILDKALSEFDRTKAIGYVRDAQRVALKDGGSGHWHIVGSITPYLTWNYLHREGPHFIPNDKALSRRSWIDQNDPSFQGKKKS